MSRFFLIFLASCSLHGMIVEAPRFEAIEAYASPGTLLILDIDDTLLIPAQTLGTDAWFQHRYQENCKKGIGCPDADPLDEALAVWEAIRHLTEVRIVEEGAARIVANLQAQGTAVMGLTTQGLALATRTVKQLRTLGFDLSKTAPRQSDCYFENGHGVLYRQGILFTSGTDKGKALIRFLELSGARPERVVFLNDKQTHLVEVERALEKAGIEFVGLRYSYSDDRVNRFSPLIADIQFRYSSFDRILSDGEAEAILNEQLATVAQEGS